MPKVLELMTRAALATLCLCVCLPMAQAQSDKSVARPLWSSLSPAQQQALAPLQREWPSIDADRRTKWLQVAARFPSMPADERARVQERMSEWSRLTPSERGDARIQFQQARQLPAADLKARWDEYQALPSEKRLELAQRAKPSGPSTPMDTKSAGTAASAVATRKRNIVDPPPISSLHAVTPTVVHAGPGATTRLLSQPSAPPVHQQSGLPKIAATEGFVQPKTLLPKRGPQGAAVRVAPASAPDAAQ